MSLNDYDLSSEETREWVDQEVYESKPIVITFNVTAQKMMLKRMKAEGQMEAILVTVWRLVDRNISC